MTYDYLEEADWLEWLSSFDLDVKARMKET